MGMNDTDGYNKLEYLGKNHLKIPIRKHQDDTGFHNIKHNDAKFSVYQSTDKMVHGIARPYCDKIGGVLSHDYLRKSIV